MTTYSYLVKRQTTAADESGEVHNYFPGSVLSDWELNEHIKSQIQIGVIHYTNIFEPLTDKEAKAYRTKATALEGKRLAVSGQEVDPPFDDYVGLHPKDIIDRMKTLRPEAVEKIREYESGGLNRKSVMEYVSPSEREPLTGYADMGVRDILAKMDVLDQETCNDIIWYEMAHSKRPAIIEYEKEVDDQETSPQTPIGGGEKQSDDAQLTPVGVGAAPTVD